MGNELFLIDRQINFPLSIALFSSTVLNTLFFWLIATSLYFLLLKIVKYLTEGSKSDLDDVVIGVTSKYLLYILLAVAGISVAHALSPATTIISLAQTIYRLTVVGSLLLITWKLVYQELICHYLVNISKKSESNLDDILIPILKSIFPLVFFVIGSIFVLQALGFNLSGVALIIGGSSFILAFALQSLLADIFSGIALTADSPFGLGDVIIFQEKFVEVKKIGMRVTELYIFDDHSSIFVPNSLLAGESIINLTHPTPDVRSRMAIGVAYNSNPRVVRQLLIDVATANPYVLGNPVDKLAAMKARLKKLQRKPKKEARFYEDEINQLKWGIEKWTLEEKMLVKENALINKLRSIASMADAQEDDGLDDTELEQILVEVKQVARHEMVEFKDIIKEWVEVILKDEELFPSDMGLIQEYWDTKLYFLDMRSKALIKYVDGATLAARQRIDDKTTELANWLLERFKDPYEPWKDPDADFEDMGDNALIFTFEFFIDDVKYERSERIGRVMSDLRRNVLEIMGENEIEIPFPQRDVWFRNELSSK